MKAMMFTGQGIFTGALTTAGAFLAMAFTDFKGIREMGIICGGGLMICLIPMLTALPALLLRGKQNVIDHQIHEDDTRARIENIWLSRPVSTRRQGGSRHVQIQTVLRQTAGREERARLLRTARSEPRRVTNALP